MTGLQPASLPPPVSWSSGLVVSWSAPGRSIAFRRSPFPGQGRTTGRPDYSATARLAAVSGLVVQWSRGLVVGPMAFHCLSAFWPPGSTMLRKWLLIEGWVSSAFRSAIWLQILLAKFHKRNKTAHMENEPVGLSPGNENVPRKRI